MATNLLSQTSKMPCKSISLDANLCITGSKLVKVANTPCNKCYALRGFYNMPSVKKAMAYRLEVMTGPNFVDTLVKELDNEKYFRWFDSGDIQSEKMGHDIIDIVELTPWCRHWLPSKEYKMWKNILSTRILPFNVCLRISTPIDNTKPINGFKHTTTTYTDNNIPASVGFKCHAHKNKKYNCYECRACWNNEISNVAYPKRYELIRGK